MKVIPIADLIEEKISGEWGSESTNGSGTKVLRTTNFTNEGRLRLDAIVERQIEKEVVQRKRLRYGDTIVEKSGGSPNQPVGRVVLFDLKTEEPYLCNNFTAILRPSNKVNPEYFFWALFYKHLTKSTLRFQNKTTGILNLKLERYLEEESIKLPDLPIQKQIAHTLSQADAARQKRREANRLTEQFLQSAFLEMFGDPVRNERGWEVRRLGEVLEVRGRVGWKGYKRSDLRDSGPYVLGATHINFSGDIDLSQPVFISKEKFDESPEIIVSKLDLLIVQRGNTIAKVGLVSEDIGNATINPCILIMRPKQPNPFYLKYLFLNKSVVSQLWRMNTSSAQPMLTQENIRNYMIMVPPISLQQEFAALVGQVERLRAKQCESGRELENLFQSLMQRYFGS